MLLHDLVQFLLGDFVTYFLHSGDDVLTSDHARSISVELVENSVKFCVIKERLDIQGSHQELCIVDLSVTEVVNLINDLVNIGVRYVHITLLHGNLELLCIDHSTLVLIESHKLAPEILNRVLVSHFDKHVHRSLLEFTCSSERCQSLEDIGVNLHIKLLTPFGLKPAVIESIACTQPLFGVNY